MLLSSLHTVCLKFVKKDNNYIDIGLAFIFLFVGLFSLVYIMLNLKNLTMFFNQKHSKDIIYLSLFIAFTIIGFNTSLLFSLNETPKTSYCLLIINLNIILTLLLSYYLFKEKMNYKSLIGILISLIGLSIVIYYSNE
jgi:drug/metabolite transporter (DMT)-like permease